MSYDMWVKEYQFIWEQYERGISMEMYENISFLLQEFICEDYFKARGFNTRGRPSTFALC